MTGPETLGVSFTPILGGADTCQQVGVRMVVSTLAAGAVFTLDMDQEFATEVCKDLIASLAVRS